MPSNRMRLPDTIVVGGVGGSATRLVATYLHRMEVFMGHDFNEVHDNLWFTFPFKRAELFCRSTLSLNALAVIFVPQPRRVACFPDSGPDVFDPGHVEHLRGSGFETF
jgi:hypothetical protein